MSLRAIHSRETQEPAHIPQEFALQIFSPGVHAKFLTLTYSLLCACRVHIKQFLVKMQIFVRTSVNETSFPQ